MGIVTNLAEAIVDRKARDDMPPEPRYVGQEYTSKFLNRSAATYTSAYGGDQSIDWVMDCVRLIMETAASAPYHITVEKDGNQEEVEGWEKDSKYEDLSALLREPNPYQNYNDLLSVCIIDLLLAGEFFIHKHKLIGQTGKPLALYRLAPAHIEVIPGATKMVAAYEYKLPGKRAVTLQPEEVIHAKLPNPHDPYRGLSIIAGGARVYDVELAMTESQAQFFEQGTKLSGVLQTDRRVPEPVFKKIQRQFKSMYSGASNAYKVAVLEAGLKFTPVQPTAAEAQFEALSKLSRDRIAHMFRVPLPLLGNLENANYKMAEAQRVFDTKTMRPLLDRIEDILTRGLCDAWECEFKIDYKYVMPDEDRFKLAESFATLPGVTVAEVREVVGLDPLDDEKTNKIVLNLPVEGEPNRPRGSEPGRPPNGENVPAFPSPSSGPAVRPRTPQLTGGRRGDAKAMFDPTNPDPLKSARDTVVDSLAHRINAAIEVAASALEVQLTNELRGEGKAVDPLVGKIRRSDAWTRFEDSVRKAMKKNAVESLNRAVEQHKILGFEPEDFDVDKVADDLVKRSDGIKSIVGNFKKRVTDVVREGVKMGLNADQILHGTGESYPGLRGTMVAWRRSQAETIALTESAEYYNEGVLRVAENSGVSHVLVLDGDDYDEPCARANGEVWAVGRARENRTEHPRCRRSFFPLEVEAEAEPFPPEPTLRSNVKAVDVALPEQDIKINISQPPPPEVDVTVNPPQMHIHQDAQEPVVPQINVLPPDNVQSVNEEVIIERNEHGQLERIRRIYG